LSVNGRIWGVGIGPGDPDLITLKALKVLEVADVVAYPTLEHGESMVRAIAAQYLNRNIEEIVISVPMVSDRYPAQKTYNQAAVSISNAVENGKSVAILCEGDPFFFGSFMYLYSRLSNQYKIQIIPGVTSISASSAELGLPIGARNDLIMVIPAPLDELVLRQKILETDVSIIIKVGSHLNKVKRVIISLGLIENAHYIERATMANQCIKGLSEIKDNHAPYFSIIIIRRSGEVLEL